MSFTKLSFTSFQDALKSNKYASITAARRAVGKATTLSDAEKEKARKLVDAHFGSTDAVSATSAKKTAAPKKVGRPKGSKNTVVKKEAKEESAPAKKVTPVQKRTPVTRQPRTPTTSSSVVTADAPVASPPLDLNDLRLITNQIRLAEKTIEHVSAAMHVITATKSQFPDRSNLGHLVDKMSATLSDAVGIFKSVVNSASHLVATLPTDPPVDTHEVEELESEEMETEEPASIFSKPSSSANGVGATRAETLFKESSPPVLPIG